MTDLYTASRAQVRGLLEGVGLRVLGELDPLTQPCVLLRRVQTVTLGQRGQVTYDAIAIPAAQMTVGATDLGDAYADSTLAALSASSTAAVEGSAPTFVDFGGTLLWGEAVRVTVHLPFDS